MMSQQKDSDLSVIAMQIFFGIASVVAVPVYRLLKRQRQPDPAPAALSSEEEGKDKPPAGKEKTPYDGSQADQVRH